MACGPHQVPLTAGSIRVVGSWEARTVDFTPLTYVGTSTCSCGDTNTEVTEVPSGLQGAVDP